MTNNSFWSKLAVAAVLCGLFFGGCKSSSNNPTPGTDGGVAGDNGGAGKSGSGGSGGGAGKAGTGGGAGTGGTAGDGTGDDGGTAGVGTHDAGPMCKDPAHNDCVTCDPTTTDTSTEFLNHCTGATCNPFDNSKLTAIPKTGPFKGKLPAIP